MAVVQKNSNGWGPDRVYGFEERIAFEGTDRPNPSGQQEKGLELNPTLLDLPNNKYLSTLKLPNGTRIDKVVAKIRAGVAFTGGTAPAVVLRDVATTNAVTIDITDATHSAAIAANGEAFAESTALAGVLNAPFVGERTLELAVTGAPTSVDQGDVTFVVYYKKI